MSNSNSLISQISSKLTKCTPAQIERIDLIVSQFLTNCKFESYIKSDIFTQDVVDLIGNALMEHQCSSREPFRREKLEYALENIFNAIGIKAKRAGSKTNQGHDITIGGVRFSLKTQADASIKEDELFISKFMELGKGQWTDKIEHLKMQRDFFLNHLRNYDRIFQMRNIGRPPKNNNINMFNNNSKWVYELVEIPIKLMKEASRGVFEFSARSKTLPRTGYCRIFDNNNEIKFALYFDGAGERKLQIKYLKKKYCVVHARWEFKTN